MADKKITQLNALTQADSVDLFPIVDLDAAETKKITVGDLMNSPGPIGGVTPDTGEFTTLTLPSGVTINEISADTALGTSDSAVPTQNAVKSYVDTAIGGLAPNRIWQGDSSVEVIDSTAAPASVIFTVDSMIQGIFDSTGLALAYGVSVNEISNDTTLASASPTSLVTEYAVKTYIDRYTTLPDIIVEGLAIAEVSDSTSESYFNVKVRDTYFGPDATTHTVVYYFNDQTSSNWINPGNMIDGNTGTYAQAGSASGAYIQINTGSTIEPSTTRNVEKVELRVYGRDGAGPNISAFNLYPVFNGMVQGNSQNLRSFLGPVKSWTPWIDITSDPAAPSHWQWSDIMNLDTKIEAMIGSPGGGIGDVLEVNKIEIQITYTESPSIVGSIEKFRVDANGISTQYGASVDEFSTDVTMADNSNNAIPTERAVKTYVDFQIQSVRNDLDLINIRHVNSDTTAVTGDVCLVNTSGGVVNIQMIEIPDGRVIVKKVSMDSNPVYVSTTPGSSIDGEAHFVIDVAYKSITFLSDGNAFYII